MILKINDRIRNRRAQYFDGFKLSLHYNAVASAFSFRTYFNPANPEHKEMLCVGHDHIATVEHNGELLVTGYILSQAFNSSSTRDLAGLGGYSLPGVLEDCQIPTDLYPLQFDGMTLREIAQKLIAPFGLKMIVSNDIAGEMDKAYEKFTAEPTSTIKDTLASLASQRNIILTHNERGNLVFTRTRTNVKPILNYGGDGLPCPAMSLEFNGQGMHSHITVQKQADSKGGNAGESTVRNPYVPFVYRPLVAIQNSGDDNDTEQAAKNILANELRNVKLTFKTDRWEIDKKIIKPNNLITVINPEIYLYKKTTWFIEQIDFEGDPDKTTATLTCCPKEVYSGETPQYIWKGINLH